MPYMVIERFKEPGGVAVYRRACDALVTRHGLPATARSTLLYSFHNSEEDIRPWIWKSWFHCASDVDFCFNRARSMAA